MRIVLTTSETNLAKIKQAYQEDYNKSIEDEVVSKGNCTSSKEVSYPEVETEGT